MCVCVLGVPVLRDIGERGRELEQVLTQYITFVKPAFEEFCLPVSHSTLHLSSLIFKLDGPSVSMPNTSEEANTLIQVLCFLDQEVC